MVSIPRNGWPRIFPPTPDHLYTNIPETTLNKWFTDTGKGHKVVVQVMRQNSWCTPQCDTTADLVARTIEAIYNIDKVRVAATSKAVRGCSQQNAPYSFLVFGLPENVAHLMVAQHCYMTELIQFLAFPLIHAATPCFLGSISGLRNIQDDPRDLETLRDNILTLLTDNYRMFSAVLEYATESSGGINGPTVNLYLDLPASPQLEEIFPAFIDAALRITFDTPFMGQG
ncbi:hypothetical protein FIBSPDRAFT_954893 [Athelia psychrophila]|uniref:Uncharacterized protein n=1 Tax=Athelia psychrophila TaxID=1759441 RepID=A0A166IPL9_9AGAM|nr:hypothetical protein FIBSPDRAFT_954893 [Fibularhizoctonia sp. CBS 109695]